ncbi:sortase-associated OmpA-like protein PdsO [Alteromonas sp. 14N.309.X.WAT.G.H12]|uniref:sortase-associated OmpA-like protein PdsO n=1 Tax=Alteromonas sp. 14N.309.X.WAT.G.H12 TaxID=3120824 RepID=UPI002FD70D2A
MMNKKRILALTLTTMLAAPGFALADSVDREKEKDTAVAWGLGTGVVLGAVVAGPIGAGVAGIFGALIGENEATHSELNDTQLALASTQSALNDTEAQLYTLRDSMNEVRQTASLTPVNLTMESTQAPLSIQSTIQFKTGSGNIESVYDEQLDLIAKTLRHSPDLVVKLTGYTDSRGEESYNQLLSEQRATAVKTALISRGVSSHQIETFAKGESLATSQQGEGAFFQRRVVVQVQPSEQWMTAKR